MGKQKLLEEEADEGVSVHDLLQAGAKHLDFADYLILDGNIYEPVKFGIQRIDNHANRVPTHYRKRNAPAPED